MAWISGAQIMNGPEGQVSVDSTYQNLVLKYRRTIPGGAFYPQPGAAVGGIFQYSLTFPIAGYPLVFVKSDSVVAHIVQPVGGQMTIWFYSEMSRPAGNVEVLIFAQWDYPPGDVGIQAYTEAGKLTYDAAWPVMMIRQKFAIGSDNAGNWQSVVLTLDNAAIAITHARYSIQTSTVAGIVRCVGCRTAGRTGAFAGVAFATGNGTSGSVFLQINKGQSTCLAINVNEYPPAPFG